MSLIETDLFGVTTDKVQKAIKRLQAFEPEEGYFVAFSGGKGSQCIYHLCVQAGVKFDAHYSVTTVDPPELVQFVKDHYPDAWEGKVLPRYADGRQITMWNLIPNKLMPPTRIVRYCCEKLKESSGEGRVTVTGVRWAESNNRRNNQGVVSMPEAGIKLKKKLQKDGYNYSDTKRGGIVLNDDNDENRRMVEQCYRTHKTLVNPIIDWEDDDVWEYLNDVVKVEHCKLYDEGFSRLGCVGCPMSGVKKQQEEFERWPKYKENYMKAFQKMVDERERRGINVPPTKFEDAENVMNWWIKNSPSKVKGQIGIEEYLD